VSSPEKPQPGPRREPKARKPSNSRRANSRIEPGKPTIRSVADRADVAISTVSRVVNGGGASALIRRRVQRAIDELGYSPSVAAQSLVTRRTGCIGLAVNSSQSPWFSQILAGVEEALGPSRKSVLLASMMLTGEYQAGAVAAWIQERRVDGLILVRYSKRDEPLFLAAERMGLPVVLIAPDVTAPAELTVRCNNVEAGGLVARHLAELGHRRVGFAGGPRESVDTRQRLEGLTAGLSERGIELDPRQIWFGQGYARESGIAYAKSFLEQKRGDRPSAVVLGNDTMALGFMRTVLQHGQHVPRDVSIVGFDGTPDGEQVWPGLTTVAQPTRRMAADACRALLRRVDAPGEEQRTAVEYGVEMLVRESTARFVPS
jgi:LacI family transcriptional regulator